MTDRIPLTPGTGLFPIGDKMYVIVGFMDGTFQCAVAFKKDRRWYKRKTVRLMPVKAIMRRIDQDDVTTVAAWRQ